MPKQLTTAAKVWITIGAILLGLVLLVSLIFYSWHGLFRENPRFTLYEIKLTGESGYWNPESFPEREKRIETLLKIAELIPGQTNLFAIKTAPLREKIMNEIPEIEEISIRKVIPDMLEFDIVERIPCATIYTRSKILNFYLDEKGILMNPAFCRDVAKSLPVLVIACKRNKTVDNLVRGAKLSESYEKFALIFIKMIQSEFLNINLQKVILMDNRERTVMQCILTYKLDPKPITVTIPADISQKQLKEEIPQRLIPALEEVIRSSSSSRILSLENDNLVVVSPAHKRR